MQYKPIIVECKPQVDTTTLVVPRRSDGVGLRLLYNLVTAGVAPGGELSLTMPTELQVSYSCNTAGFLVSQALQHPIQEATVIEQVGRLARIFFTLKPLPRRQGGDPEIIIAHHCLGDGHEAFNKAMLGLVLLRERAYQVCVVLENDWQKWYQIVQRAVIRASQTILPLYLHEAEVSLLARWLRQMLTFGRTAEDDQMAVARQQLETQVGYWSLGYWK